MTDADVVARVARLFERAVMTVPPRHAHHKTAYSTSIKGRPAVALMQAIEPFMSHRRRGQIERAIASWLGRRARGTAPAIVEASAPRGIADVIDARWLAGLLEGEGCFSLNRSASINAYPVIGLQLCDEDSVVRAAALLGGLNVHPAEPTRAEWRRTFKISMTGNGAARWMRHLRPLMGLRRQAASDAALAAYVPIRLVSAPELCIVSGCREPHRSRGLCHKHYMSWMRDVANGRDPRVTPLR
ncbi:MAG TPA: hypothetical protein VFC31_16295 [Candidatus Limnocylindria bacterium]|nr:hypothetical protein [Candidatus Limnocylindria bacterium]